MRIAMASSHVATKQEMNPAMCSATADHATNLKALENRSNARSAVRMHVFTVCTSAETVLRRNVKNALTSPDHAVKRCEAKLSSTNLKRTQPQPHMNSPRTLGPKAMKAQVQKSLLHRGGLHRAPRKPQSCSEAGSISPGDLHSQKTIQCVTSFVQDV